LSGENVTLGKLVAEKEVEMAIFGELLKKAYSKRLTQKLLLPSGSSDDITLFGCCALLAYRHLNNM